MVDDPLDVLRCAKTFFQPPGDMNQRTGVSGSKGSFERFRDILRLAQPKPPGRPFNLYQLFAITLHVLDEEGLLSVLPGQAREHYSRRLGGQEKLDDVR